jgi:hypothetical protein
MDLEDRIREAVRQDRLPEPSAQFHSRVMASLPDRTGTSRRASLSGPSLLRFAALGLVAIVAIGAVGLPLMLSGRGAAVPGGGGNASGGPATTGPTSPAASSEVPVSASPSASLSPASPEPSLAPTQTSSTPPGAACVGPVKNGFCRTGAMNPSLSKHIAVALADGRVLLLGGYSYLPDGQWGDLYGAQLYDPQTGTFSKTGEIVGTPLFDTATLLTDGRVLLASGATATGQPVASAELYDPNTGTFSMTGSMNTVRESATATLLADGRVLIAGGYGGSGDLSSAELYDPKTGKFRKTGSMTVARQAAIATRLKDGRVIIIGGDGPASDLTSAELYDPRTGTFSPTGPTARGRGTYSTAITLADGRVFVVGGDGGGAAELYDPSTGMFARTGTPNFTVSNAVLLLDGRVLVTGMGGDPESNLKSMPPAAVYDPSTGSFRAEGPLLVGRTYYTTTLLPDGCVLIAGGNDAHPGDSAELYVP